MSVGDGELAYAIVQSAPITTKLMADDRSKNKGKSCTCMCMGTQHRGARWGRARYAKKGMLL
jgi:hypothetical protein